MDHWSISAFSFMASLMTLACFWLTCRGLCDFLVRRVSTSWGVQCGRVACCHVRRLQISRTALLVIPYPLARLMATPWAPHPRVCRSVRRRKMSVASLPVTLQRFDELCDAGWWRMTRRHVTSGPSSASDAPSVGPTNSETVAKPVLSLSFSRGSGPPLTMSRLN